MTKTIMTEEQEVYITEVLIQNISRARAVAKVRARWPELKPSVLHSKITRLRKTLAPTKFAICMQCGESFQTRGDRYCDNCQVVNLIN